MTGFIMSKSSQQAPVAKPDPLAQYPERYSAVSGSFTPGSDFKMGGRAGQVVQVKPNGDLLVRWHDTGEHQTVPVEQPQESKPEQYDEESQTESPKTSADRLADLKARSAATERRLQDTGMFGAGKGPPGLDQDFTRRQRQRAETIRGLKQDHPDLYADQ